MVLVVLQLPNYSALQLITRSLSKTISLQRLICVNMKFMVVLKTGRSKLTIPVIPWIQCSSNIRTLATVQ